MSEKIYVVSEYFGRGGHEKKSFSIDRKYVERSFELFIKQDDDEIDSFDEELTEVGYDYDRSSAVLESGTIGAYVNDMEIYKRNKEAFLSKEKGWMVEGEEVNHAFGATKEQALLAFAQIDMSEDWD